MCGIFLFPFAVASTFDPCEAVSRVVANKIPKNDLPEFWNLIATEVAIKVGTTEARNHGILACYRALPLALNSKQEELFTKAERIRN